MSRPNSAPVFSVHGLSNQYSQPQTVTTKVTTTAKLKVELHAPSYCEPRAESSSSNGSSTREFRNKRTSR